MRRRPKARKRPRRGALVLPCALLLSGCAGQAVNTVPLATDTQEVSSSLPFDLALARHDVRVEIMTDPFSYRVLDGAGRLILSAPEGEAQGAYGALGWADGEVSYSNRLSPGYTAFAANLPSWHCEFELLDSVAAGDALTLHLAERGDPAAPHVSVTFSLRPSVVRVSALLVPRPEITARVPLRPPRAWSVAFSTPKDEAFLGFGERFNRTNQRGLRVFSWAEEGGIGLGEGTQPGPKNPWPSGETMSSYPVPFFLSSRGYGFWLDTFYRSEFDLAASHEDAWRVWHVGPRLDFEVFVPTRASARLWTHQVIDRFTEATGRPLTPPAWAFGPRRRVGRAALQEDVPEIQAMRDEDLAVTAVDDAVHFFPSAAHHGKEQELAAWVSRAAQAGYRVNAYYNSLVADDIAGPMAPFLEQGLKNGYFLSAADGSRPETWIYTGGSVVHTHSIDFTNDAASRAYQETFRWATSLGYSGFMYDFGEYVPFDVRSANGMSGEELHNAYPLFYAKALFEGMQRSERANDWLAFMRSGYTGASAYVPMVWSGDPAASFEAADGLPSMIRAGVNLGISGVPHFGGDIGGYHCLADGASAANDELLVRWIQQGALSPNMQDQDACVGVPKHRKKASIWTSAQALSTFREYARLHTRLFPYLYSLSKEAAKTGVPLLRHPFLEHPDQLELAAVDDAYYLGPALFVAPVVARGERVKRVHLPRGVFVDFHHPRVVYGGGEVDLPAPLEELPLLLRSGTLLPLLDKTIDTLAAESSAEVIGPEDVAEHYDVLGALTLGQTARLKLYDGTRISVAWQGPPDVAQLGKVVHSDDELRQCATRCYRQMRLSSELTRLEVTTRAGVIEAGGLRLDITAQRTLRLVLYLVDTGAPKR